MNIRRRDLWNFDEAGFRIGCLKGQEILVPNDVKEYYSLSPENRRSLTIFEAINAIGSKPLGALIIIEGKQLMHNWFPEELDPDYKVITSQKGFTSNEIAM